MTTKLPVEIVHNILKKAYVGLYTGASFTDFLKLCLVNHQFKSILYRRREDLMLAHSLVSNFYAVESANPFANPYVIREFVLNNMLSNAFHDNNGRQIAHLVWKNKSWFDAILSPNFTTFGEPNLSYSVQKTGFPKRLDCFCILGDINWTWDDSFYDYGFVRENKGVLLLAEKPDGCGYDTELLPMSDICAGDFMLDDFI